MSEVIMEYTGTVKVIGGIGPEEYPRAKITRLGDEFKLVRMDKDKGKFVQVDRITQGKLVEGPGGTVIVSGLSETFTDEVGLAPENATIQWEMKVRGCQSCR